MQANREYLMQLNPSEEIARYIHLQMVKMQADSGVGIKSSSGVEKVIEQLPVVLMYNLDKERLEEALRKRLILRLLDSPAFNSGAERALSDALRNYFGGKFNHRLQLLIEAKSEEESKVQSGSDKLTVTTLPATAWP